MDSNSRNGNNSGDSGKGRKENREKKTIKMTFNMSWLYILLIFGIIWMFFNQGGANPQKIEWADVKEMVEAGDVKEITFIRNDFEGKVTMRPDRLEKYADRFGGTVPSKSPHFFFLVSSSFNAEEMFSQLNDSLTFVRLCKRVGKSDAVFLQTFFKEDRSPARNRRLFFLFDMTD